MDFLLSMNFPELKGNIPGDVVLGVQGPQGKPGVQGPQGIPGPQGEPFTYEDFTPEQLEALRGPQGDPFTYEDFTPEQLEALRGEPGVPGKDGTVSFDELTEEQRESLRGDPFTYEDFTEEQLAALKGEPGTPGKDGADGEDGYTPQIELLNVVEDGAADEVRYGVTIRTKSLKEDGTESIALATVWDGKNGAKGEPGDDYVLTPADKTEIAEMAAGLVEVPESGGEEVWEEIATATTTEDLASFTITEDANGQPFNLKKACVFARIRGNNSDTTGWINLDVSDGTNTLQIPQIPNGFKATDGQDYYHSVKVDVTLRETESFSMTYSSTNNTSAKDSLKNVNGQSSTLASRGNPLKWISRVSFRCNGMAIGTNTEIFVYGVRA